MTSKIKILLFFFLIISGLLSAQDNAEIVKIKKEIAALFQKAGKSNLQNVLTYKINGKIGFVDAVTNKKLLNPTSNLQDVTLFKPNMKGLYKKLYNFEISGDTFNINVEKLTNEELFPSIRGMQSERETIEVIDSKGGFKGFTVDVNGKLTSYSNLYYDKVSPFLFEGKYYAMATKQTGPDEYFGGIIDTDGVPLPHFNFIHKCLTLINYENDDIWFTEGLCRGLKGSFISFKGKVKFKDELVGSTNYSNNIFEYNHNHSDDWEVNGILDVYNMEWVMKPQTAIKIQGLGYTSKKQLDESKLEERPNANVYFLVEEGKKEYFMDFKMKKYLPVK
ncbi:hypothetical protein [Flavobacterium sp. HJJ]|uniref:hypothetical protein n=1 Tax=Flavobacterium sp. HJJ TaxID=2783792 RepID=UPI00188B30DD|nr:hypothetical protein [Flavobacterium sp. HJJ]MBF4472706.1 hypothetical protein [Flavobacterium sp. HJJ]